MGLAEGQVLKPLAEFTFGSFRAGHAGPYLSSANAVSLFIASSSKGGGCKVSMATLLGLLAPSTFR